VRADVGTRLLRLLRRPRVVVAATGFAAFLAVAGLRALGALEDQELAVYDLMVAARARETTAGESRVSIVAVDDADILRWGWPLSDELLARAIERLQEGAPAVIGIDLYRDVAYPPGGEGLAAALGAANVIGVAKLPSPGRTPIPGPPSLAGSGRVGFTDFPLDRGGVVRRGLLYADSEGETLPSFGLLLALGYLARQQVVPQPGEVDPTHLRLGRATLAPFEATDGGYTHADAAGFQLVLDFRGGERPFPTVGLTALLEGRVPRERLTGRMVLLGVTAESVKDLLAVPIARRSGESQYGVTVHSALADQLVRMALDGDAPLRRLHDAAELAWIAACAVASAALGWNVRGRWRSAAGSAVAIAAIAGLAFAAFAGVSLWIPVVAGAWAWALAAFLCAVYASQFESAQRAVALGLFGRYVPRRVAEDIWARREELLSESGRPMPRRLVATVFFSDIEGFTTISERLEPPRLAAWLGDYLSAMAGEVAHAGGVVDKFVGDAVMAVFGVPIARENEEEQRSDARSAVRCALAMRAALSRLNQRWRDEGLPEVRVRAGIHTGPVVAGSFGNAERLEYTVIGDTVNVASRIEGFDKSPVDPAELVRIHVSDATLERLGGGYATKEIGEVALKGRDVPVRVHRLSGMLAPAVPDARGEGR
jgi:adenylate cyclase